MKKIVSIVGARPQFIKLAPLSREIRKEFREVIVHTGQHYDQNLSGNFFVDLDIREPDYNLNIALNSHGVQTGNMIIGIEKVLKKEKPDLVIVFGDTNSTLAGSLVAPKMHIPLLHIEAGLRSFNKTMPEEINRIVSDHVSDYLFAPTKTAVMNLKNENLLERTHLTGDIMIDSLNMNLKMGLRRSYILDEFSVDINDYHLLTLHRPYNVDPPGKLKKILEMLGRVKKKIVFPAHPRTKKVINRYAIDIPENLILAEPVGYFDFIVLEYHSSKIITDSGGVQKEAYILKKPCLTIRPETEWVETVEDGWNLLISPESILSPEIINSFEPENEQSNCFGENVTDKMASLIKKLIS